MWTGISRTITAESELVSLAELKEQLRLTADTFDSSLIPALIAVSREYVERMTDRCISASTYALHYDRFEIMMYLPKSPITSLTSIQYKDENGDTQTLDSSYYSYDIISEPARIYVDTAPTIQTDILNAVTVNYSAVYTSSTIPNGLKQAIISCACAIFENPEEQSEKVLNSNKQIQRLLNLYKIHTFF